MAVNCPPAFHVWKFLMKNMPTPWEKLTVIKFDGLPSKGISIISTGYNLMDQSSLLFAFLVMQSYKVGASSTVIFPLYSVRCG